MCNSIANHIVCAYATNLLFPYTYPGKHIDTFLQSICSVVCYFHHNGIAVEQINFSAYMYIATLMHQVMG